MERFNALEGGRGLLALVVMLVHFEANYHGKAYINAENLFYFIDYFFVFSGFLMARIYWDSLKTRTDFGEYMIIRTGRVYPLHFAWLMLFIAFECFRLMLPAGWLDSQPFTGSNEAAAIPLHLLLVQAMGLIDRNTWNFPSWSLSTEFYSYIVFAMLMLWLQRGRLAGAALIAVLSCLALWCWSDIGFQETYYMGFYRCLTGFMVGVMLYPLYMRSQGLRQRFGLMTVLEIAGFTAFFSFALVAHDKAWSFASPLITGFLIWVLTYDGGAVSRVLSTRIPLYLGGISYSMYLAHVFIQDRMLNVFKLLEIKGVGQFFVPDTDDISPVSDVLLGTSPWLSDLFCLLMFAITIGVSHYTFRWIEEPGREWAKQLVKRRRKQRAAARQA